MTWIKFEKESTYGTSVPYSGTLTASSTDQYVLYGTKVPWPSLPQHADRSHVRILFDIDSKKLSPERLRMLRIAVAAVMGEGEYGCWVDDRLVPDLLPEDSAMAVLLMEAEVVKAHDTLKPDTPTLTWEPIGSSPLKDMMLVFPDGSRATVATSTTT